MVHMGVLGDVQLHRHLQRAPHLHIEPACRLKPQSTPAVRHRPACRGESDRGCAPLACSHSSWTAGAGGGDGGDCGVACSVDEHASSTSNVAQPARTAVRIVPPLSSSRGTDSVAPPSLAVWKSLLHHAGTPGQDTGARRRLACQDVSGPRVVTLCVSRHRVVNGPEAPRLPWPCGFRRASSRATRTLA